MEIVDKKANRGERVADLPLDQPRHVCEVWHPLKEGRAIGERERDRERGREGDGERERERERVRETRDWAMRGWKGGKGEEGGGKGMVGTQEVLESNTGW